MDELETLVANHEHLTFIRNGERVQCTLTKHELLTDVAAVRNHLKSKAYRKATWYAHDYTKYEPYVVAHKRDPKKLYCTLTKMPLNRIPDQIVKHVNGKKFKRLKRQFEEKQKEKQERQKRKDEKRKRRREAREIGKPVLSSSESSESSEDDSGSESSSSDDNNKPPSAKKPRTTKSMTRSLLLINKKK